MPGISAIKKIVLSFFVFLLLTFSFIPYVRAQEGGVWYNQSFQEWYGKVYDSDTSGEIFGERYTAAQVQWIIYGLFAFVLNATSGSPETTNCLMNNDLADCAERFRDFFVPPSTSSQRENLNNEGFISFMVKDRPMSGITYFKNMLRKYSLIPEAQAQSPGFGFRALDPVLNMWKASRNIAYALLVIAIVTLSFMVMFRVKISPQVVITAQSAIPKIVAGVILITFSYAIAGFLVDLMYVVIGIISLLGKSFIPFNIDVPTIAVFNFLTKGQPFFAFNLDLQFGVLWLFAFYIILFIISFILTFFFSFGVLGTGLILGTASIVSIAASGLLPILGIILLIVLAIVVLFFVVKIFWTLIKAFATVFLLTIFAPFYIVLGVVVQGIGFGSWLRNFISNLSVFVITGFLFFLSYVFLAQAVVISFNNAYGEGFGNAILNFLFGPRVVESTGSVISGVGLNAWPPLLGWGSTSVPLLFLGVSFVIFALIPKTSDIIKSIIERKPFAYGAGMEAIGPLASSTILKPLEKYGAPESTFRGQPVSPEARNIINLFETAVRSLSRARS